MQYELQFEDGRGGQLCVLVPDQGLGIGRSAECDVRVNHPAVSRMHVRLKHSGDSVDLEYLGSRKGIKVNGNRVTHAHLQHGDTFQVGDRTFRLVNPEHGAVRENGPQIPKDLLRKYGSNRLVLKRDPQYRALFQRACQLTIAKAEPAQLVQEALMITLQLLDAERAFLIRFSDHDDKPQVLASRSRGSDSSGPNLNGALLVRTRATGAPTLKVDERPLPPDAKGERPSALCAPIRCDGRIVGAIYADSAFKHGEFNTHSLDDLRAYVQIVGPLLVGIARS